MDESREAVVLISTTGTILFCNKAVCLLFGYKKIDMEGKNVSMLMPPPFSQNHNNFLRNYQVSLATVIHSALFLYFFTFFIGGAARPFITVMGVAIHPLPPFPLHYLSSS
jgi:PAS domain-containing protein